jgi:hypothetical protein
MVTFFACDTSHGRSFRRPSPGRVSIAPVAAMSWLTDAACAVSAAAGGAGFSAMGTRHGRSAGVSCPESVVASLTVVSAAPRASASWVSTESQTGIGRASVIDWVT